MIQGIRGRFSKCLTTFYFRTWDNLLLKILTQAYQERYFLEIFCEKSILRIVRAAQAKRVLGNLRKENFFCEVFGKVIPGLGSVRQSMARWAILGNPRKQNVVCQGISSTPTQLHLSEMIFQSVRYISDTVFMQHQLFSFLVFFCAFQSH